MRPVEFLQTLRAFVRLYFQMSSLMIDFVSFGRKRPPAICAEVGLFSGVSAHMVSEASSLRKSALTVWIRAGIWLDPQMYILMPRERRLRVKSFKAV